MECDVETVALSVFGDPKPDHPVHHLEDDEGDGCAIDDSHDHAQGLRRHLTWIAVDEADWPIGSGHDPGREYACQERAGHASDAMDAEGIERVVIPQQILQRGGCEVA